MSSMQIDVVKNGFIVRPIIHERHAEASNESIVVFETHKALFDYIEKSCPIYNDATQE